MKKMDRRAFVRTSVLTGVGASMIPAHLVASGEEPFAENRGTGKTGMGNSKKVIVAGGGISGLCCAYELMKKGHEVVLLEASGRFGGAVLSVHDGLSDGLYADFGAENFTKPGYENYWKYIEEFNLASFLTTTGKTG
jgi:monoamine oxidase